MSWRYVDGFAAGTSHLDAETPCQDRSACRVVAAPGGDVLVCVVSDGAGSAAHSDAGAQAVCDVLLAQAVDAVRGAGGLDAIGDDDVAAWFALAREHVCAMARAAGCEPREYAATALLAVAGADGTICAQIGDGAIALREGPAMPFEIAVWPENGEYANHTYFVTDDDAGAHVSVRRFAAARDVVALTDGLQSLALEFASRSAFPRFFEPLVETVRDASTDDGALRDALIAYLGSDAINARTDDDKCLAIGCRIGA